MRYLIPIIFLLTIPFAYSADLSDWYSVEPWELEYCSIFGGSGELQSTGSSTLAGATVTGNFYLSQTAMTLQGERELFESVNGTTNFYTVSYYVEPIEGIMDFSVHLSNNETGVKIASDTASFNNPGVNFMTFFNEAKFDYLTIRSDATTITVPLV